MFLNILGKRLEARSKREPIMRPKKKRVQYEAQL